MFQLQPSDFCPAGVNAKFPVTVKTRNIVLFSVQAFLEFRRLLSLATRSSASTPKFLAH